MFFEKMSSSCRRCCAVDCANIESDAGVHLFRFPKDENRCKQWKEFAQIIGNHVYANWPAESCYKRLRLCHVHFENRCFGSRTKQRLTKTAIPTLNPLRDGIISLGAPAVWEENTEEDHPDRLGKRRKSQMICAVASCRSDSLNDPEGEITFHNFPSDRKIKDKWVEFCQRPEHFNTSLSFLCNKHFREEDYEVVFQEQSLDIDNCRKLIQNAIPSLYEEVKVKKEIEEESTLVEEILLVKEETVVKEEIDDYFEENTSCSQDIDMIEEKPSKDIVKVKEENEYKLKHEHLLAELNTQKLQIAQLINDSENKSKIISDLQGMLPSKDIVKVKAENEYKLKHEHLLAELDTQKLQIAQLINDTEQKSKTISDLQVMLSTVVQENNILKEQIVHFENLKETKNKTITDLEEMLAKLFHEFNTQKQQLAQFKRDTQQPNKSSAKEELMQCEETNSESDSEDTVSLSVSLQRLEKEHNSQKEQLVHLEKDCDEINKTVSDLEEQVYKLSEALNDENALLTKVFSKAQRKKLQKKFPLIWSKDDMLKSFKLLSLSRRSYKYIRKELNYPLPHLVTIDKWVKKHNIEVML